jgi:hypothetical protein
MGTHMPFAHKKQNTLPITRSLVHSLNHIYTMCFDQHTCMLDSTYRLDHSLKHTGSIQHACTASLLASNNCSAMAPNWTAADMEAEIKDVTSLWLHRSNDEVAKAMVKNTVLKLRKLGSLKAGEAIKLYQTIDASKLPEDHKAMLSGAVDAIMTSVDQELDDEPSGYSKAATLLTLWNYLTQPDWDQIELDDSYWGVITVVVERLKLLGVDSMKESTCRWVTASILDRSISKSGSMPTYEAIFQLTKDIKAALASCSVKAHPELPKRTLYPESPEKILGPFMALAYKDTQPVKKDLKLVTNIAANHVPMRETSKLLAKNKNKHEKTANMGISAADVARELLKASADGCPITLLSQDRAVGKTRHALEEATPSPRGCRALVDRDAAGEERPISPAELAVHGGETRLAIQDGFQQADACAKAVELFKPKLRRLMIESSSALDQSLGKPPTLGSQQPCEATSQMPPVTESTPAADAEANGKDGPKSYTAEEYEQMAFDALTTTKNAKKTRNKQANKRPAAEAATKHDAKPEAKAAPKAKAPKANAPKAKAAKAKAPKAKAAEVQLGCTKCRGSSGGCAQCLNPFFKGWRGDHTAWKKLGLGKGGKLHSKKK